MGQTAGHSGKNMDVRNRRWRNPSFLGEIQDKPLNLCEPTDMIMLTSWVVVVAMVFAPVVKCAGQETVGLYLLIQQQHWENSSRPTMFICKMGYNHLMCFIGASKEKWKRCK
jgi:hypothetical protein